MKKEKKIIIILSIVIIILIVLILTGITVFSMIRPHYYLKDEESDSKFVPNVSTINFNYKKNELILENMIANNITKPYKYLEFTLEGKNLTSQDIECQIKLTYGSAFKNIRIKDNLLKFKLVELNNNYEKVIFSDITYQNINDISFLSKTINQNEEINKTYRLYIYVTKNIKIGNTNNSDYTSSEWENDVYATVKIIPKCKQKTY